MNTILKLFTGKHSIYLIDYNENVYCSARDEVFNFILKIIFFLFVYLRSFGNVIISSLCS